MNLRINHRIHSRTSASILAGAICCGLLVTAAPAAQGQDRDAKPDQAVPSSALTTKSTTAVGYEVGTGSTKVNLIATDLATGAYGQAKVQIKSKADRASVDIEVKGLKPASTIGNEFLTYVLWDVTPEGRTDNLGEVLLNKNGDGKLGATTPAQAFSLVVTAEPYFAVRIPSEMVVLQSEPTQTTQGKIIPVSDYKLMKRAQYQQLGNPLGMTLDQKIPLSVYEARNAVEIAKSHLADKYAPEAFAKATSSLQTMNSTVNARADNNTIISEARQAAQFAEDARALSVQIQEVARIQQEKEEAAAAARAQAEAKAAADAAEAKRKADDAAAEARRKADEAAAEAKSEAEEAAAEAQRQADDAAAEAKQKADAEIAAQEAARKQAEAQQAAAEKEKQELRERLLQQFNRVLPTTDTDRGLVVNMGDVLFATGKADLNTDAKIALAKLTGIVLNYPSLKLAIGGYTDSTGTADFNMKLSQARADTVLDYLAGQGLDSGALSSQGYGVNDPVADNSTAQGRQKNRRVEIVISGEVIGTQIGPTQAASN
jgi:outer membrane protein OmpA-like peptidoglycan-associated protein